MDPSFMRYEMSQGRQFVQNNQSPSSSQRIPTQVSETPAPQQLDRSTIADEIKLVVSQPGRERHIRLDPELRGHNAYWFGLTEAKISRCILKMMHGMLNQFYPTYESMPWEDKHIWFRQFTQEYTWDPEYTREVEILFHKKCALKYSDTLYDWKQVWRKELIPTGPCNTFWEGAKVHWTKPKTVSKSSTNSKNRKSERKGVGMSTHNLGAMSSVQAEYNFTKKNSRKPHYLEVLEFTHTNKKDGTIQDPVARGVIEASKKRASEILLSQQSEVGSTATSLSDEAINDIVIEETPKNKGRWFGLGSMSQKLKSTTSSRFFPTQAEYEAQLKAKDDIIDALLSDRTKMMKKFDEIDARFNNYVPRSETGTETGTWTETGTGSETGTRMRTRAEF